MNADKPQARGEPREGVRDTPTERVGTHPVGTTTGAVAGAVAGAVSGLAAGPIGSLAGAVGGAVLGGTAGSSTGITPDLDTSEYEAYWRDNHAAQPYAADAAPYESYAPAYRYAIQAYLRTDHPLTWDEAEPHLAEDWTASRGESGLEWSQAREAARAAWQHMRNEPA